MKHARDDYDRIQDPAGKIAADEPVFLVRGKDFSGPGTVADWVKRQLEHPEFDVNLVFLAVLHVKRMHEWQQANGCKTPDL